MGQVLTTTPQTEVMEDVVLEEVEYNPKSVAGEQEKNETVPNHIRGTSTGDAINKSVNETEPKALTKKNKKKSRKKKENAKAKAEELNDPSKILASVLDNSNFKVPNLSSLIEEKFYIKSKKGKPIWLEDIDADGLKHEVTVGETVDGYSDVSTSVLPIGFTGVVDLHPAAVTKLDCIYHLPTRSKYRRKDNLTPQQAERKEKIKRHRQQLKEEQKQYLSERDELMKSDL